MMIFVLPAAALQLPLDLHLRPPSVREESRGGGSAEGTRGETSATNSMTPGPNVLIFSILI